MGAESKASSAGASPRRRDIFFAPLCSSQPGQVLLSFLENPVSSSNGELLFLTEPCELAITIDAAHDHTTLSALQILRLVDVVGLKRNGARRPPDLEPSLKMQMGDELTLRALPHVLSTVAVSKGGKVVLAPKHARDKLARQAVHSGWNMRVLYITSHFRCCGYFLLDSQG